MSPTLAIGPVLSRCCDSVCVTCPALHAESATGDTSSTPTTAARRARFTAFDLQQAHVPATAGSVANGPLGAYRSPQGLRPEGSGPASRSHPTHLPRTCVAPPAAVSERR